MSNKHYTIPSTDLHQYHHKKSLKERIKSYLNKNINGPAPVLTSEPQRDGFNKQFEGWNLRLHRANNGHIIEAWKNDHDRPVPHNHKPSHELFMVPEDEDMGKALNDVLIQLMLRG